MEKAAFVYVRLLVLRTIFPYRIYYIVMSSSASAKRPGKINKLELRGLITYWKYCSNYWQSCFGALSAPNCVRNVFLSRKSFLVVAYLFSSCSTLTTFQFTFYFCDHL